MVNEPWISGWTQSEFKEFLSHLGFDVIENTTAKDYNELYMKPIGRSMDENQICSVERFVVATIV